MQPIMRKFLLVSFGKSWWDHKFLINDSFSPSVSFSMVEMYKPMSYLWVFSRDIIACGFVNFVVVIVTEILQ